MAMEEKSDQNIEIISCWPPDCSTSSITSTEELSINSKHIINEKGSTFQHDKSQIKYSLKSPNEVECLAEIGLARWWRTKGRTVMNESDCKLPSSSNPKTVLNFIAKTKLATAFMEQEVYRLRESLQTITDQYKKNNKLAALASYYEKLKRFGEAKLCIEEAVQIKQKHGYDDEYQREYQWLKEKICKEFNILEIQKSLILQINRKSCLQMPSPTQVERRSAKNLSVEVFYELYSKASKPVIITDLVPHITTQPWSLQHIREIAGSPRIQLKKLQPESVEWARLEDCKSMTISSFIDGLNLQENQPVTNKTYLFDQSIPIHFPRLAEEIVIPKYFANDFLQRTSPESLYRNSWPSLFIAPAGLRSELHVDAFGSNFWMALFEGRKRWLFFSKDDTPLLYPQFPYSMDPVFDVNLGDPDFDKHPLLMLTNPVECILEPGEVLFVPAGCPHHVENLEKSLAISANFVDKSNFEKVKKELATNALVDERSQDLLQQFNAEGFNCEMDFDVKDMPLEKYKIE